MLQGLQLRASDLLADYVPHVFKTLRQKAACAAAGVIDRLANLRVHDVDHRADDFARREELAAVVSLFAHFQQQTLIHLGKRENVRGVHRLVAQFVDLVQHVTEILFRINPAAFHSGHHFADDLLARRGVRFFLQPLQMGEQFFVYECPYARLGILSQRRIRRGPIPPAIGRCDGRCERQAERLGFLRLVRLPLVQDAQKQNPRQFRHIIHGARHVGAAHDVANGFHRRIERLRRHVLFAVCVIGFLGHQALSRSTKSAAFA